MDVEEFWKLIDTTREATDGNASKQADLLAEILVERSADEIFAYERIIDDLLDKAYDAALWDAADIIGCGCSDDGFLDFRGWLIAQGQEVYENAQSDPQSLVNLINVDEDARNGYILSVVYMAYEQKTGQVPPITPERMRNPPALKGDHWTEENIKERFPKLVAKFGDCEQRWTKWMAKENPK